MLGTGATNKVGSSRGVRLKKGWDGGHNGMFAAGEMARAFRQSERIVLAKTESSVEGGGGHKNAEEGEKQAKEAKGVQTIRKRGRRVR